MWWLTLQATNRPVREGSPARLAGGDTARRNCRTDRLASLASPSSGSAGRGEQQVSSPFTYLTVANAELYRRVMFAFVAAKRASRCTCAPRTCGRRSATRRTWPTVADALSSALEGWGNLRADPDTSRVTTRRGLPPSRFLYQLTHGRARPPSEALAVYDEALGRRGALQAVALDDIATQLRALLELARREAEPDPAKAHLALCALEAGSTDLAENAQAFMGSLQRTIDLHDVDVEAFLAYKDRLIDYLRAVHHRT